MLTQRLRTLEEEGIVERRVIASSPVQVEYPLRLKGRDLEQVVDAMMRWSHRWIPTPPSAASEDVPADSEGTPAP
ncbi:helix-turn-helix transcriptional regulator [Actinacidiphila glaucinigra]|uniref:winged helix-turn-helix transcriptional regulator n=1 Tax=Actinacidiphila glaucinigra TaxID=235986 RepID=UPI00386E5AC8